MTLEEYSLIPEDFKKKDPRQLLYHNPTTINIVAYAKKMQQFSFYQALEVAEIMAKKLGYILVPYSCFHWQRAKAYAVDRKIKIGRNTYFMMKPHELTKTELKKLKDIIEEEY